jgi:hypothetical protein
VIRGSNVCEVLAAVAQNIFESQFENKSLPALLVFLEGFLGVNGRVKP